MMGNLALLPSITMEEVFFVCSKKVLFIVCRVGLTGIINIYKGFYRSINFDVEIYLFEKRLFRTKSY